MWTTYREIARNFFSDATFLVDKYHWKKVVFHSLKAPFTNGFTEGCNNKIKVLKRNAYGYRRFDRFRNRILHIFSHQRSA